MQASPSTVLLSHFHIDYNLDSPRLVATVHQNVDKRAEENKSPASLSFIYVSVQISLLCLSLSAGHAAVVCYCVRKCVVRMALLQKLQSPGYVNRNGPHPTT